MNKSTSDPKSRFGRMAINFIYHPEYVRHKVPLKKRNNLGSRHEEVKIMV